MLLYVIFVAFKLSGIGKKVRCHNNLTGFGFGLDFLNICSLVCMYWCQCHPLTSSQIFEPHCIELHLAGLNPKQVDCSLSMQNAILILIKYNLYNMLYSTNKYPNVMSCFTKLVKKVAGFPQHVSQLYILAFYINTVTDKCMQKSSW